MRIIFRSKELLYIKKIADLKHRLEYMQKNQIEQERVINELAKENHKLRQKEYIRRKNDEIENSANPTPTPVWVKK